MRFAVPAGFDLVIGDTRIAGGRVAELASDQLRQLSNADINMLQPLDADAQSFYERAVRDCNTRARGTLALRSSI